MGTGTPEVAYYGYVLARTGYGTAARGYVHALDTASVPMSIVSLDRFPHPELSDPVIHARMAGNRRFVPSLHVWHTEPHAVMKLARSFTRLVVLTTWEAESLPATYVEALNRAAEVWVPSHYNQRHFSEQLSVPVFRLPHPVNRIAEPRLEAEDFERELGLPQGCFVAVAVGTWQERKNLDGAIEAFLRAFPRERDAFLIVKTSFAFVDERMARSQIAAAIARANVPDAAEAEKRIRIFPYYWPEDCLSSLLHRADCHLSLHRGEGWCYPLFDAASLGVPVVATGYSGPMDYLDGVHHSLVGYRLTAANQRRHTIRFAFDSSMNWAEPDLEDAALCLRRVYEDRQGARRRASEAAATIRRRFSLDTVGEMARLRVQQITEKALRMEQESLIPTGAVDCASNDFVLPSATRPGRVSDSPWQPLVCN